MTSFALTVKVQDAVLPLTVVTLITAVLLTAASLLTVTRPLLSTVATFSSLDDQVVG